MPAKPHPFGQSGSGVGGEAKVSVYILPNNGSGFCFLVFQKVVPYSFSIFTSLAQYMYDLGETTELL